ncbi:hypothetical protein DX933_11395 [Ornithinibacillus gellani]|uniref:hypothetical protein n=1 Tax=Ornithinibacillus gellani TaxID=2293253 RepID=UPI000F476DD6|nr:hypothetical protein [Ornithinibacillus gellani]TQS74539.1 hypothetical protein DX933_11395 [Ornithinibacillus gellani]
MKKSLSFIQNSSGFMMPLIMLLIVVILYATSACIHLYINDLQITERLLEQKKVESIIQLAEVSYRKDMTDTAYQPQDVKMYHFPNGTAEVSVSFSSDTPNNLFLRIHTNNNFYNVITMPYPNINPSSPAISDEIE